MALRFSKYSVVIFVCVGLVSGCAHKQIWYQQGKGQVDYDQNTQECTIIASNFARQATMTRNYEDPGTYQQTMVNCLVAKGWSASPPGKNEGNHDEGVIMADAEPMIVVDGSRLRAFGSDIKMPSSFVLSSNDNQKVGPARGQTTMFSGPQSTFVTIMAQEIDGKTNRFIETPYVVKPPFFLYEHGAVEKEKGAGPERAIFCGVINGEWVMGLGAYLLISKRERLTVIVTQALVADQIEPEAGFRLSREQFARVDSFAREWTSWLVRDVVTPKKSWWAGLAPWM